MKKRLLLLLTFSVMVSAVFVLKNVSLPSGIWSLLFLLEIYTIIMFTATLVDILIRDKRKCWNFHCNGADLQETGNREQVQRSLSESST